MKVPFLITKIVLFFLISGWVLPASAASVKELERQIAELKRVLDSQAQNLATALNQIQEVLGEFQKIHGQVDSGLHADTAQDQLLQDNQRRLEVLEDKIPLLAIQLEELKTVGLLAPSSVKNLNEFQTYQKALSRVNAEDYKGAIVSLKAFLAENPKSPYAANAQYWIGESYYAQRDYPAAVSEYQKVVKKYPKHGKTPPALLKQGMSFFKMQSFTEAKDFLAKLVAQYPGTNESVRAGGQIREINHLLELKEKESLQRQSSPL